MSGLSIMLLAFCALLAGYLVYGRWLAATWGIDPKAPTPAHTMNDGVDYVPAKRGVVFGHQFASIAGAGPINGPIIAAMFGWVPVLLWIILGGIFFGAVQDFASFYASVKCKGKTIGYIIELYIGKTGKRLFLLFVWLFSILVVAAFADIVSVTFNGFTKEGGLISANASVASTSILFVAAAVGLGIFLRRVNPNGYLSAAVAIALTTLCIALGIFFPLYLPKATWLYLVFAYILVASVTPVWALLQPRDYLNSFLLVAMILASFVGVLVSNPEMRLAPFNGFVLESANGSMYLFPILFVTVACGAVSGFHSLVSSGTASKQVNNEKDILPIAYGGMMLECLLAVIALVAVGSLAADGKMPAGAPPMIFAQAVAGFLASLGLPTHVVYVLITLAISAFALTSLDSVARVGRVALQELFTDSEGQAKNPLASVLANRYVATAATLLMGYLLSTGGYLKIWALFGSSNQLLAALALLACAVFLKSTGRKSKMLYIPMIAMLLITLSALAMSMYKLIGKLGTDAFNLSSDGLQLVFAVLLSGLGIMVACSGIKKLRSPTQETKAEALS